MEVIMLKDVPKVGRKSEVVTVSEGYAINFLIPKGLAKAATSGAKKEIEMKKGKEGAMRDALCAQVVESIKALDGKTLTIHAKANDKGHLFAAIHKDAVNAKVFAELGICLPDTAFSFDPLKELGTFDMVAEGEGAKGTLTLIVERE
ncbi:MAG: 50S ribosomal protein L9 [Candidatus Pacebacteria bacterium]|nr:50S ribosomal protein L9 [Candidatus Paceibacterota bacterium]